MPTIKTVLAEALTQLQTCSQSSLLDAEILLCKILAKNRSYLRAWPDNLISPCQLTAYQELINQRKKGFPIAYLTGIKEFWSREFIVSPDVLIPRPETELLIELSLNLIPKDKPCKIIDLGTGSGIIAVTLAAERPQAAVTAIDISAAALAIAKINAADHDQNAIRFYQSSWFENVPPGKFDLIISNPPYVAEHDPHLKQGDLRFEPLSALTSGEDGLTDIGIIAEASLERLECGGFLMVEHGYNQESTIQHRLNSLGYVEVQTYKDLAGIPRVTIGRKPE